MLDQQDGENNIIDSGLVNALKLPSNKKKISYLYPLFIYLYFYKGLFL